jgi:hypothetical protein
MCVYVACCVDILESCNEHLLCKLPHYYSNQSVKYLIVIRVDYPSSRTAENRAKIQERL